MRVRSSSVALLVVAFLGQCIVFTSQVQSRCPVIRLANGRVRSKARGRIVKFSCYEGFTLVGNKYSTCVRGQWNTPAPVCVNAECPAPPTPEHAQVASKYNGGILMFFCEPGYVLIGPAEIYCDGKQWNGTAPHCRDTTVAAPTQCDFEKPDICWWEQDPQHDFDWQRHNFETPSSHIGTGPTYDHSLGKGNEGHYLYIEATGRLVNDTARIFSPLYNSSYTQSGCFSFWYHMFGATIGALHIYFKQESDAIPQLMFKKEGNQGNQWIHGIFDFPKSEKNFQIIIEGVRGSSYASDIAVDDVAILQGDKCKANKFETATVTPSDDDQIEQVNAQQSCRGRCKSSTVYEDNKFSTVAPISEICYCTLDCAEHAMCCLDYAEYCVLEDAGTELTEIAASTNPTRPLARNESDIVTVRPDYYNGHGISIIPKDDIDPITSKSPVAITTASGSITTATRMKTVEPYQTTLRRSTVRVVPTKASRTKETPFVSTMAVTRRYVQPRDQPDPNKRPQDPMKFHRATGRFTLPGIIGLVFGVLTGISVTMMVVFFILRKRKTYKRGTSGSALSEDSDVRFLTSDEILDFTLARPNDNEES